MSRVTALELVEGIAKQLVNYPDDVEVSLRGEGSTKTIELNVREGDAGGVIGKKGAHAHAIRTILAAVSGRDRCRYILEVVQDVRNQPTED